jgi:hypothetical protein
MKTTINGRDFHIEEFNDGWGWISGGDESQGGFGTACEATQDAMAFVRKQKAEECEQAEPDTYQAEVCQFFDRRDYQ